MTINDPLHPGARIKAEILPAKMSVTKAAELIGVGRPALSNLLNGKASLSVDMAARIGKAFGVPRDDLLEMQAQYSASKAKQTPSPVSAKMHVPPFLSFKANDIQAWAEHNIVARSRFAVFLRTLIHSTGIGLTKVDFPGNDDAERPGWDGEICASEGTPWIPTEHSGWEFGTNEDPTTKAEDDYKKSLKTTSAEERAEMTFVFVTPRRWPGKDKWLNKKKAEGVWRDVRAYNASDLEQWLEQSLPAQAWFANETKVPFHEVRSLDACWANWASVATPPLPGSLFSSAIEEAKRKLGPLFTKPPVRPIIIAADSTDEALAFVAQCLGPDGGAELASFRYRVLVFDKVGVLPRLAESVNSFIPVIHSREVEVEFAPYVDQMRAIIVYPRNTVNVEPDIILEPVSYEVFESALESVGKNRDEIKSLANESGRSLTVLRRRMASVEAVRMPIWATQLYMSESLIAFMSVGVWNALNETDKAGLSLMAGDRSFDELEKDCQRLLQLNDAPVWSINTYRGVISQIDLLYAIARNVTREDLTRYFEVARIVLDEDDPSLDLPENQRWAAAIHGKTREFSLAFRRGISETLVLLAVHGVRLFKERLGIDTELEATKLVRNLLPTPLTTRILEANDADLPLYAEAAPTEFLSIIERDLKTDNPAVFGLLHPVGSGMFNRSSRTGLLWALERLAWNVETFPRSALILARLAQIEINDNWTNKPENSLEAIFWVQSPQTAANNEERLALMKKLFVKFPNAAWKVCIAQFGNNDRIRFYNQKPKWRPDGYGHGEPCLASEAVDEMIELALTRVSYTAWMLCDLIDRLNNLSKINQARVWEIIESWAETADDGDKVILREKIRTTVLSRNAALRMKRNEKASWSAISAKDAYAALEPSNLIDKHAWLFKSFWIEESVNDLENIENIGFEERNRHIHDQRTEALVEINEKQGVSGLLNLAIHGGAPEVVGSLSAEQVLNAEKLLELVVLAFQEINKAGPTARASAWLIQGILGVMSNKDDAGHASFLRSTIAALDPDKAIHLLMLAPFGKATWRLVSAYGVTAETQYWNEVEPRFLHDRPMELIKAVDMLMDAKRPRAAFALAKFSPEILPIHTLAQLLDNMLQGGNDKPGEYMLGHHHVEKAFECITNSPELSLEQKASLEFKYLEVLTQPWVGIAKSKIPNLERYIEDYPEVLVKAIVWAYKRDDHIEDPPEFKVEADRAEVMAERGYKLIQTLKRIPGSDEHGDVDSDRLAKWVSIVRRSCAELSRAKIADIVIGKLFALAPAGKDDVWPCEAAREVMEDIQSEDMMHEVCIGVYNSRGVHFRGPSGEQERQLAEKYSKFAQQIRTSFPYVASELLQKLADLYKREAAKEDIEEKIRRRL